MRGQQLALGVQLAEASSFENFFSGPNAPACQAARAAALGRGQVYLYGAPGSGKTHLLQAAVREADLQGRRSAYLPLARLRSDGVAILEGLEAQDVLALDDLQAVITDRGWALALLRLLDELRARQGSLLVGAAAPPDRLSVALPDLRTRLTACAVHGLQALTDEERLRFLQARASARGLELGEDVGRFLLARLPRDTATLLAALDTLDRASLSARRRLTLPFVQQALREAHAPTP